MAHRQRIIQAVVFLVILQGCSGTKLRTSLHQNLGSVPSQTQLLAVYEPWFGHPQHISVGYSSHDPAVVRKQIEEAKARGISGFVVDWYGDREPFLDRSYALLQSVAAEENFHIAMMFDETTEPTGPATDDTLAAFKKFRETYLAPSAPGRQAYLTYQDRPVIFIFPKGGHTNWNRVRAQVNSWNPVPLLIYENQPTPFANVFDGFYAWVNPGSNGFAADGSNWGEDYLRNFYAKMNSTFPGKILVGTAWPGFDDSKAAWGSGRFISQRCGETFTDTLRLAHEANSPERPMPYLLIATWNDYEEGTAIERGLPKCDPSQQQRGKPPTSTQ